MPISIVGGKQSGRGKDGNVSRQTFTLSTATADQQVNYYVDQVFLANAGTATNITTNRYTLASGAEEGREIWITSTASGTANIFLAGGTATGRFQVNTADDWVVVGYMAGRWWIKHGTAATASYHFASST